LAADLKFSQLSFFSYRFLIHTSCPEELDPFRLSMKLPSNFWLSEISISAEI